MTVLIIGGSGCLGTELVRQAAAAGHATAATFATGDGPSVSCATTMESCRGDLLTGGP